MPFWNLFGIGNNRVDVPEPPGLAGPGLTLQNRTPTHNDHLVAHAEAVQGLQAQQAANNTGAAQAQVGGAFMGAAAQGYQQGYTLRNAYYGTIINYTGDYAPPIQQRPRQPDRTRGLSITQALEDLGYVFANEGLSFHEIIVPKTTFLALYARFGMEVRAYHATDPFAPPTIQTLPSNFIFNTAMGRVKIICEETDKKDRKFDLESYLEVV